MSALGRQREEDHLFEISLDYTCIRIPSAFDASSMTYPVTDTSRTRLVEVKNPKLGKKPEFLLLSISMHFQLSLPCHAHPRPKTTATGNPELPLGLEPSWKQSCQISPCFAVHCQIIWGMAGGVETGSDLQHLLLPL